jgi:hypothetical protein
MVVGEAGETVPRATPSVPSNARCATSKSARKTSSFLNSWNTCHPVRQLLSSVSLVLCIGSISLTNSQSPTEFSSVF